MSRDRLFLYLVRAIVMVTALPVHECAHALVASKLGDNTARNRGRLTLNPFVHLDLWGSVLLIVAGFGWAKPVPVDPRNFKHPKRGMALSSLAGPLSNLLYAVLLMCIYKTVFFGVYLNTPRASSNLLIILSILDVMISVNIYLAVFNFLPVPPLDGAKIIGGILPDRLYFGMMRYERYIALVLFVLILSGALSGPLTAVANILWQGIAFATRFIDLLFGIA